jgi:hypothetical protein
VQERPNRMVMAFGAESAGCRLSALKAWRNQKCRASGAPRLGNEGSLGEVSRKARRDHGEIVDGSRRRRWGVPGHVAAANV